MSASDLVAALRKSGGLTERQIWFNFGHEARKLLPSLVKSGQVIKWRSVNAMESPDMGEWTYREGSGWGWNGPWKGWKECRPKRRFTLYKAAA